MRIISSSKYNAHSEPLFKVLDILKIEHLFSQSCLKFVYKFKKSQLPKYFLSFQCVPRSSIHDHDTKGAERVDIICTRTHMAAKCIRSHLPVILNDTPAMIINKINTHSIQGFSFFIKRYYLSQYTTQCQLRGCLHVTTDFFHIARCIQVITIISYCSRLKKLFLQILCYCRQCHNQHYQPSYSLIPFILICIISSSQSPSRNQTSDLYCLCERDIQCDWCFSVRKLAQYIQDLVNFDKFISPPRETYDSGYCLNGLPSTQHPLFT